MRIEKDILIRNPEINVVVKAKTSIEEVDNIWYLINNITFFDLNNYEPIFPKHGYVDELLEKKRRGEDIEKYYNKFKEIFENEIYILSDYEKGIKNAKDNLGNIESIFEILKYYVKQWNFELFSNYIVSLSLYGTSGAYYSTENEGIINLRTNKDGIFRRGIDPSATIVHEIIHIGIEKNIIAKYDISHNMKERIVDKFLKFHFNNIFPEYELKERGDKSVDIFIETQNDWDNLPSRILELKKQKE